jgi:holo-[acyl-carrier protein] synthase
MKLKTGVDLLEIKRIEHILARHGDRFLERIYTAVEIEQSKRKVPELAVRFAAKEAASKALGTGIGVISWKDVEVYSRPSGEPHLRLHGSALRIAQAGGYNTWAVSLSHSHEMAIAVVTAIGE